VAARLLELWLQAHDVRPDGPGPVTCDHPARRDRAGARARVRDAGPVKPSHEEGLSTRSWDARPEHLTEDLVPTSRSSAAGAG
jgi:hypothetical protein